MNVLDFFVFWFFLDGRIVNGAVVLLVDANSQSLNFLVEAADDFSTFV